MRRVLAGRAAPEDTHTQTTLKTHPKQQQQRYRGGTREGVVEAVHDGRAEFTTQRGKAVEHKLETLAKHPDKSESCAGLPEEAKEGMRVAYKREMGHR